MLVVRLLPTAVVIAGAKQNDMSSVFLGAAASMLHSSELSTVVGWRDLVPTSSADVAEAMLAPGVELVFHTTIAALDAPWQNLGCGEEGVGRRGGGTGHRKSQRPHRRAQGNPETIFANSLGSKLVSVTEGTVDHISPHWRPSWS